MGAGFGSKYHKIHYIEVRYIEVWVYLLCLLAIRKKNIAIHITTFLCYPIISKPELLQQQQQHYSWYDVSSKLALKTGNLFMMKCVYKESVSNKLIITLSNKWHCTIRAWPSKNP